MLLMLIFSNCPAWCIILFDFSCCCDGPAGHGTLEKKIIIFNCVFRGYFIDITKEKDSPKRDGTRANLEKVTAHNVFSFHKKQGVVGQWASQKLVLIDEDLVWSRSPRVPKQSKNL